VGNNHGSSVQFDESGGLQATEVSGNQLAHRSNVQSQFLIAHAESEFHSAPGAFALAARFAIEERREAMVHGGKG